MVDDRFKIAKFQSESDFDRYICICTMFSGFYFNDLSKIIFVDTYTKTTSVTLM